MFQDFFNWQINILCIFWFNILRLFIPYTYTQNSLHFNSSFSSLTLLPLYIYLHIVLHVISCQIHINQKWCHLPSIFWRHQLSSNIGVSSNLNRYELATTKEKGLHFILNNNGNYDFDIKVGRYGFVGFVNDVIDCGCLRCVFCFKIKEKEKDTFYINELITNKVL